MELRRFEVFLAVVDEGSFTDAADALGISQPAVSQAVRSLEAELGVTLFHRLGRGVRLTDGGEALVAPARLTLRDAAAARDAARSVSALDAGHLELACLPTLAVAPLSGLVGEFRRIHPGVTITLLDPDDSADLLDLVRSGRCEVGLTSEADVSDLVTVRLAHQEFHAILPPGHATRSTMSVPSLADMPMVASPRGTSSRDLLDAVLAEHGLRPRIVVESAQREALLPLVLAGAGAALVPVPLAEAGGRLGCDVVSLEPPVGRPVVLVHRRSFLSPAASAFLELARRTPSR